MKKFMLRTVLTIAAILIAPTAGAAEPASGNPKAEQRPAEKGPEKHERREKAEIQKSTSDLDACKRDAHGLEGPERSRFMTGCLKQR